MPARGYKKKGARRKYLTLRLSFKEEDRFEAMMERLGMDKSTLMRYALNKLYAEEERIEDEQGIHNHGSN